MKQSIAKKLQSLTQRLVELDKLLSDPHVTGDMDQYRKLSREHAECCAQANPGSRKSAEHGIRVAWRG